MKLPSLLHRIPSSFPPSLFFSLFSLTAQQRPGSETGLIQASFFFFIFGLIFLFLPTSNAQIYGRIRSPEVLWKYTDITSEEFWRGGFLISRRCFLSKLTLVNSHAGTSKTSNHGIFPVSDGSIPKRQQNIDAVWYWIPPEIRLDF